VPVPDELIVNLKESREAVEALLDNLANTFAATTSVSPYCFAASEQFIFVVGICPGYCDSTNVHTDCFCWF